VLTNIFTRQAGDTDAQFHAAADGKGATFVVLDATDPDCNTVYSGIVGGYNPQSWNSSGSYNITTPLSQRTAFLFNLTTNTLFAQRTTAFSGGDWSGQDAGEYQTYNSPSYGPTFGGGHDIYVTGDLTQGHSFLWSYNPNNAPVWPTASIVGGNYDGAYWTIRGLEVFTVAVGTAPEPTTLALLGLGLAGLAATRRRK
jgi:hypothetical protein